MIYFLRIYLFIFALLINRICCIEATESKVGPIKLTWDSHRGKYYRKDVMSCITLCYFSKRHFNCFYVLTCHTTFVWAAECMKREVLNFLHAMMGPTQQVPNGLRGPYIEFKKKIKKKKKKFSLLNDLRTQS
jgi:hypothetical protein